MLLATFPRRGHDPEEGFVLITVILLTVLLLISLAVAAPKMAMSIQRDKELEAIHRGEQYRRALQLYYRQLGNYPTSVDQLLNTNNVRYLRKRYKDPLTGKDDWKPVLFGQAHVHPLGFFGQPLTGIAGIGTTSGSMYAATTSSTDANGVPVAGNNTAGSGSNTGFGSGPSFGGMAPSAGSGAGASMFGSPSSPTSGSANGISSMFGSSPGTGSPGTGMGSAGTGFGSSTSPGGGTSATTFGGGGPIVGFTLPVNKPSLVDYMQQTRYNKWEFNYDPIADQAQALGGLTNGASSGGTPATTANPFGGTTSGPGATGNGISSMFGNNGSSGSPMGSSGPSSAPTSPNSPQPQ